MIQEQNKGTIVVDRIWIGDGNVPLPQVNGFGGLRNWGVVGSLQEKQELSYRQQIARKLRTRYAEGIYRHKYYTVTLKSRLRVTQAHWKRNHWIDHTRLSSSRVI